MNLKKVIFAMANISDGDNVGVSTVFSSYGY